MHPGRVLSPILLASLLWLAPQAQKADACGGSEITSVGELLVPQRTMISELVEDPYEGTDLNDFRFLRPFELAGRDPEGLLARARGEATEETPEGGSAAIAVDMTPFTSALQRGDGAEARRAAQAILDRVLSMPAPLASENAAELQRAAEYLELSPQLAGLDPALCNQFFLRTADSSKLPPLLRAAQQVRDSARSELPQLLAANPKHPRAAALELVRIGERMHRDLPSGWPGQIEADPKLWDALERDHDAWLKANPSHPLRDLATLSKLRLLFLRGDARRVWDLLLELYTRRPLRAAWEMRHVLLADQKPAHVAVASLKDPVLASALVRESAQLTLADWSALWKRSEQGPTKAWGQNLQERLFVQALRLGAAGTPPPELPAAPRPGPQRWAALHTAALLAAHRDKEALAQARLLSLKDDRVAARLLTHAHLRQCDWVQAAASAQALGPELQRYLLEVVVDDAGLVSLTQQKSKLALPAARALALRKLQSDQWPAATELFQGVQSPEASARREAAQLAADSSADGRLRFAKFLLGKKGEQLLPDSSRAYSRGLKAQLELFDNPERREGSPEYLPQRLPEACGPDRERERLAYVLLRGGRRERALELYVQALGQLDPAGKQAKSVLKDADALYNKLLNWDSAYAPVFEKLLAATDTATQLREAGKRIRVAPRHQ